MSGKDGLQLLKDIRSHPGTSTLPVVMCTAISDRATVVKAAGLAVSGYIVKPFVAQKIIKQMATLLHAQLAPEILDEPNRVCARLGIDLDTYGQMVQMLTTDVAEAAEAARAALANDDREAVALRLTALSGACRNLGAPALVKVIGGIEASLASASTAGLMAQLDLLESEGKRLTAASAIFAEPRIA